MRTLLSALLLALLPLAARAQSTVHGTVSDQQTGAPVAGAAVVLTGTRTGTVTDDAGAFTLSAEGAITSLTVSRAGYETQQVTVAGVGQALDIRLIPSPFVLSGVRVTATRTPPAAVVLTQHDLQRATGLSLENAVNTVPGLFMQSRTPWGGARVTLRGYYPSTGGNSPNSNGLGYQVFLNDIPVTDATGTTVLDDIDYSMLGNVEIIKGPASSLYGSFIGGTLLLNTARPTPNQTSLRQQVIGGGNGLMRTNTSLQAASGNSDVVVNYGHQDYDSFRPHSGSLKEYVRANGDFTVSDAQTLSAYFAYNRSFEELAGEIDSTEFYGRVPASNAAYLANDSHIQLTSFLTGLTDRYRISDRFSNQTTIFGSGRRSGQPFAHGFTDANQFSVGGRTAFGYTGQLGAVGVHGTLGGMMQRSNVTSNGVFIIPAPPFPQRPSSQQNYATSSWAFTEWNFALPSAVTLTLGASLAKTSFSIHNLLKNGQISDSTDIQTKEFDAVITPRVALIKDFGGGSSVYASVSSGYTPPLLSDAVSSDGTVNTALDPERAVQYEVGTQATLLDNRLRGKLALFDIENTDKLVTQTVASVKSTINAGKQRNRGAELSLSYLAVDNQARFLSLVRPWATYAYTDAKFIDFRSDENNDANTLDFSGNAVPRVPRNMVSAGVDLATRVGIYLDGTYRYVDKVPVTFDNALSVRSYDLLGAKLGYERKVNAHWLLDVFAGGDNLLGSTYYSFLFVGPTYSSLAQDVDGGRGDGYIIPAPYKATFYGNIGLTYAF